jgi:hypothetical protein
MSKPTREKNKPKGFKKEPKETKVEEAKESQALPKKTGLYTAKNIILLVGCILLMGLGAGLYFGVGAKFEQYPSNHSGPQEHNAHPLNQPPNTQNTPIQLSDQAKQPENQKILLDFLLSKSKKDLSYLVLSHEKNTYLLAITEDKNIRRLLNSKQLHIGQKVEVETSEPIKFKNEPKEVTELKRKLKRVTLVKLKKLKTIETRGF